MLRWVLSLLAGAYVLRVGDGNRAPRVLPRAGTPALRVLEERSRGSVRPVSGYVDTRNTSRNALDSCSTTQNAPDIFQSAHQTPLRVVERPGGSQKGTCLR